ncbi:uncharacterized protein [Argopecten irradians]|uniref:uncharacterized protein n=1 Tax=Argopecten irradians TaxID=31199 RepID=UPI0037136869
MCATAEAGRLVTFVLTLLCWSVLTECVKAVTVSTPQNGNNTGIHDHYRCMYCRKAEHILDCLEVVTCAPHEVCFIEKEMLPSGWPVINAGCRSRHRCNLMTCFGESMHGYNNHVKKRSTLSCHHCCEGEFCNLYGCPDSEDMMVLPSTRCLACDAVKDPIYCDKMINCPYSQQCVSYGVFHAGGLRFELGCEERVYCGAFKNNSQVNQGKRDVNHHVGEIDLASTCCDAHLCNRNWPMADQPLPKVISGFTCHHQTQPSLPSNITLPASSTVPNTQSTTAVNTSYPPSQAPPATPSAQSLSTTSSTTANPTTSSYGFTIPTSENCKDRDTVTNCDYRNQTNHLCDTVTLTSVYYCVNFCGFCTPQTTKSVLQWQTSPLTGSTNTPTSATLTTKSVLQGQTSPNIGRTDTSTSGTSPSTGSTDTSTSGTSPTTGSTDTSTSGTRPTTGSTDTFTSGTSPTTGSTDTSTSGTSPSTGSTDTSTSGTSPTTGSTDTFTSGTSPTTGSTDTSTSSTSPTTGSTDTSTSGTSPITGSTDAFTSVRAKLVPTPRAHQDIINPVIIGKRNEDESIDDTDFGEGSR